MPVKGPRPKHVPERSCIACRQVRPKRELVRVVRTLAGDVEIDPSGKKAGRGAYLCRRRDCWELAIRKRSLEHALQTSISPESKEVLQQFGSDLPEETSE